MQTVSEDIVAWLTSFFYAFTSLVDIREGQRKVTEPSAQIIVVCAVVLSQLKAEVLVFRAITHEGVAVLLLHDRSAAGR
jgi:hypothetical protein